MANDDSTFFLLNVGRDTYTREVSYAKIDPDDAERILLHRWRYTRMSGKGQDDQGGLRYVMTELYPTRRKMKLHRFLLDAPDGVLVDHINGDPLDNRKRNLRLVTDKQNVVNARKWKWGQSRFKGVARVKSKINPWRAYICDNRRQIHLGLFDNELDAARAYDKAAKERWGEYACLNLG